MCGLAGIVGAGARDGDLLRRMAGTIAHRGPDDQGIWIDDGAAVGFAHRRLAIVDLSAAGHQPMVSGNGRFVLVLNGEIYNHMAIRAELNALRSIEWRGHSDTETLLEAIVQWGLRDAVQRVTGMFAIALWDRQGRTLQLARDRFGEKPLYYGWMGGDFAFASELKALRQHPGFESRVDRVALRQLIGTAYISAPRSIYQGLFKLLPGCILTADEDVGRHVMTTPLHEGVAGALSIERYWSYREVVRGGLADQFGSEAEALERLEAVLAQAIAGQAVADVPVGAFLSGGIDSSVITALYQAHSPGRVKTFSIGFEEAGFNEAEYAKNIARHLGTEHREHYLSVGEAREVITTLPAMYDEPMADSSQIPTYLVSRIAREHVTVALSGDAGDELFGGYNRYLSTERLWRQLQRVPVPARRAMGGALARVSPAAWDVAAAALPASRRPAFFGARVRKFFGTMRDVTTLDELSATFLDEWNGKTSPVLGQADLVDDRFDMDLGAGAPDLARLMYCDAVTYLPDDVLCKVDRAAMAVSLETRIPFLDHHVAAVAARIPLSMKIRDGQGKHILRQLLYKHAPRELFDRPKSGFAVPVGQWLKGPLRAWAEELLDPARMRQQGFLDADMVQRRWRLHLAGANHTTQPLWSVLMFQAWLAENG